MLRGHIVPPNLRRHNFLQQNYDCFRLCWCQFLANHCRHQPSAKQEFSSYFLDANSVTEPSSPLAEWGWIRVDLVQFSWSQSSKISTNLFKKLRRNHHKSAQIWLKWFTAEKMMQREEREEREVKNYWWKVLFQTCKNAKIQVVMNSLLAPFWHSNVSINSLITVSS